MTRLRSALLGVLLAAACATPEGHHVFSFGAQTQGDPRIGQYRSSDWSLQTASYWIVGPQGLVLIDAQLLESAVIKQNRFAEAKSGLRPVAAIVLHASPDRFNGTRYLKENGIPVWTAESVQSEIPHSHAHWWPRLAEKYRAARYPRELVLPDSFGAASRTLSFAGLSLTAHVLGPGTSPSHVVVEWEGHLFVGNLLSHGAHAWYEGGSLDEWLARLEELRAMNPRWVHPGRGPSGGPELIDAQLAYVLALKEAVAAAHSQAEVLRVMRGRFPSLAYPELLSLSVRHAWQQRMPAMRPRGDAAAEQRAYY